MPIKTAVQTDGRATVRAVLATPSFHPEDLDALLGEPVNADVQLASGYLTVSCVHAGHPLVAATTVPAYLLWDGTTLRAVTPRVFAQGYTVVAQTEPELPASHYHG